MVTGRRWVSLAQSTLKGRRSGSSGSEGSRAQSNESLVERRHTPTPSHPHPLPPPPDLGRAPPGGCRKASQSPSFVTSLMVQVPGRCGITSPAPGSHQEASGWIRGEIPADSPG